jgi:hypothetical protein
MTQCEDKNMCVICVKNKNVKFPEEKALRNCWDNNPDMGGFMYAYNNEVYIKKGYMTYEDFSRALNEARKVTGDDVPYVLHFRISTQGYDKDCCQPFPLSEKMKNLRKCKSKASIGVAHNGILSMTSDGAKDYSDTMKFITDYLVDIIRGLDYHKDKRTVRLIEHLIDGSRFAILGRDGFCSMLGNGWIEDKPTGLWYSNNSYAREPYSWNTTPKVRNTSIYDDEDYWDEYWGSWGAGNRWDNGIETKASEGTKSELGKIDDVLDEIDDGTPPYDFKYGLCPHSLYDEDAYCSRELCDGYHTCQYVKDCNEASRVSAKKLYKYLGKKKPCTVVGAVN